MDRFPKAAAPKRRVVRTVWLDRNHWYDVLDCGHNETGQYTAEYRRCRTCLYPAFPGVPTEPPRTPTPIEVDESRLPGCALKLPTPATPAAPSVPADEPPAFLTVREVADLLRVDIKTIYRGLEAKEIPGGRRIRGTLRISRRILLDWCEGGATTGNPPRR